MMKRAGLAVLLLLASPPVLAQDELDRLDIKAQAAFEAGDYNRAIALWSEVVKIDPKDSSAWFNRGLTHERLQHKDEAIADFSEAIRTNPSDTGAREARARVYLARIGSASSSGDLDGKDTAAMVGDYKEILRRQPESPHTLDRLVTFDNGYYKQALSYWDAELKRDPKDAFGWFNRAEAHVGAKEKEKALADFAEAVRLDPSNRDFFEYRSAYYNALGDKAAADADHMEAVRLLFLRHEPITEKWAREQTVTASGHADRALGLTAWNALRKLRPNDAEAWLGCASYCNDPGESLADCSKAIQLDPKRAEAYDLRARLYMQRGDNAKAAADLGEVIKLKPGDYLPWVHRADLFNNSREWDKVIADCDEALRRYPQSETAFLLRHRALKARGLYEKALGSDLQYIAAVPESPEGYVLAAWICAACPDPKLRDGAKAMELAQKSLLHARNFQPDVLVDRDISKEMEEQLRNRGKRDYGEATAALAAGEADCGKWDDAVAHARLAIEQIQSMTGAPADRLKEFEAQLALYRQKQTYSEKEGAQ